MSIAAVGGVVGISLMVDKASGIENPKEIIDLFIKNNNSVLAKLDNDV